MLVQRLDRLCHWRFDQYRHAKPDYQHLAGIIGSSGPDLKVVNLAQAGARVHEAIGQARQMSRPRHSLIIVEIGGNDLLGSRRILRYLPTTA